MLLSTNSSKSSSSKITGRRTKKEYVRYVRRLADHSSAIPQFYRERSAGVLRYCGSTRITRPRRCRRPSIRSLPSSGVRAGRQNWTVFEEVRIARAGGPAHRAGAAEVRRRAGRRHRTALSDLSAADVSVRPAGGRGGGDGSARYSRTQRTPPRLHVRKARAARIVTCRWLRRWSRNCATGGKSIVTQGSCFLRRARLDRSDALVEPEMHQSNAPERQFGADGLPAGPRRSGVNPAADRRTACVTVTRRICWRKAFLAPNLASDLGHASLDTTVIYTHLTALGGAAPGGARPSSTSNPNRAGPCSPGAKCCAATGPRMSGSSGTVCCLRTAGRAGHLSSCRTPALGGQRYRCDCGQHHFAYHSCSHRACPQCGHADATQWLRTGSTALAPRALFLVTFTVPERLRAAIRARRKFFTGCFARAPGRWARWRAPKDWARIGRAGVFHTWTRDPRFHPHVHYVVPGGDVTPDGLRWVAAQDPDFFLPQGVLAARFRNRLKQVLQQAHPRLLAQVPAMVWRQAWVADVQPVGRGEPALKYLAAYVYRTALETPSGSWLATMANTSRLPGGTTGESPGPPGCGPKRSCTAICSTSCPRACRACVTTAGSVRPPKQTFARIAALLDWRAPALVAPSPLPPPKCPVCKKPMQFAGRLPRAPP